MTDATDAQTHRANDTSPPANEFWIKIRPVLVMAGIGIACILLYSFRAWVGGGSSLSDGPQLPDWVTLAATGCVTLATSIAIAGGASLTGALLGFLFGFPRPKAGGETTAGSTGLNDVSDWLTKILLGAGISQLNEIVNGLGQLADFLGPGMEGSQTGKVFVIALVIYYFVIGFFFGYLWISLDIASELTSAQKLVDSIQSDLQSSIQTQVQSLEKKQQKQYEIDAATLNLVEQQLDKRLRSAPMTEEQVQIIRQASAPIRSEIFRRARDARKEIESEIETMTPSLLSTPTDQITQQQVRAGERQIERFSRVATLFQYLIKLDKDQKSDQYHAELGYTYRYRAEICLRLHRYGQAINNSVEAQRYLIAAQQSWKQALEEINQAITIRIQKQGDDSKDVIRALYTLNRALSLIQLSRYSPEEFSPPDREIIEDLRTAIQLGFIATPEIIREDPRQTMLVEWINSDSTGNRLNQLYAGQSMPPTPSPQPEATRSSQAMPPTPSSPETEATEE